MKFKGLKYLYVFSLLVIPLALRAQSNGLESLVHSQGIPSYEMSLDSMFDQQKYLYLPGQEEDATKTRKPVEKPIFVDVLVGLLGVYSLLDKAGGAEIRASVNSSYISIPIQYQWLALSEMSRLKTWPSIFFKKRSSGRDEGVFISIFNDSIVRGASHKISRTEIGMGGGFSGQGFSITAFLTTNLTQGKPKVRDLFSFRTITSIAPIDFFYLLVGFRIGAALAEGEVELPGGITQKLPPTSAATVDLEVELGVKLWRTLKFVIAIEGRSDNFGALLDEQAQVGGISSAIQLLVKSGLTYQF